VLQLKRELKVDTELKRLKDKIRDQEEQEEALEMPRKQQRIRKDLTKAPKRTERTSELETLKQS